MALEEVDLGKIASVCVGAVSAGENFGTWLSNGFDKVFNDGQNQKEYVDYIKQIEDANAKIRQAKKDAPKVRTPIGGESLPGVSLEKFEIFGKEDLMFGLYLLFELRIFSFLIFFEFVEIKLLPVLY